MPASLQDILDCPNVERGTLYENGDVICRHPQRAFATFLAILGNGRSALNFLDCQDAEYH
jgi:hypothetical protein